MRKYDWNITYSFKDPKKVHHNISKESPPSGVVSFFVELFWANIYGETTIQQFQKDTLIIFTIFFQLI